MKPKLTLDLVGMDGSPKPIQWDDWGAVRFGSASSTRVPVGVEIDQAVRVRRDEPFQLRLGQRAEVVCWGVMPSGMLRHPSFLRWIG